MSFKENLLKKMTIDRLADQVARSLAAPADSPRRIDREAMQALLAMGPFRHQRERDLDLYFLPQAQGQEQILVLDNELKIYHTTPDDVALRKSPTIKEMVSIRNAIRILNDKDVVTSAKAESVRRIQQTLVRAIDLRYTAADLDEIVRDGSDALKNSYADGVIEAIDLFTELLGWKKPPKAFQATHHHIRTAEAASASGNAQIGPMVIYSLVRNRLSMLTGSASYLDKAALQRWQEVINGDIQADLEGDQVLETLKAEALKRRPSQP